MAIGWCIPSGQRGLCLKWAQGEWTVWVETMEEEHEPAGVKTRKLCSEVHFRVECDRGSPGTMGTPILWQKSHCYCSFLVQNISRAIPRSRTSDLKKNSAEQLTQTSPTLCPTNWGGRARDDRQSTEIPFKNLYFRCMGWNTPAIPVLGRRLSKEDPNLRPAKPYLITERRGLNFMRKRQGVWTHYTIILAQLLSPPESEPASPGHNS